MRAKLFENARNVFTGLPSVLDSRKCNEKGHTPHEISIWVHGFGCGVLVAIGFILVVLKVRGAI